MIYRFHGVSGNGHHYLVSCMNTKGEILKERGYKGKQIFHRSKY